MAQVPSSRIPELKEQNITVFDRNFVVVSSDEVSKAGRLKFSGFFDLAVSEIVRKIKANPSLFDSIAQQDIVYPLVEDLGNNIRGYATELLTINTMPTTEVTDDRVLTFRGANIVFLGVAGFQGGTTDDYIILDRVPSDTVLEGWTYGGSNQFGTGSNKYYFFRRETIGAVGTSLQSVITNLGIEVGVRTPPPPELVGFTLSQFATFLLDEECSPVLIGGEPVEFV